MPQITWKYEGTGKDGSSTSTTYALTASEALPEGSTVNSVRAYFLISPDNGTSSEHNYFVRSVSVSGSVSGPSYPISTEYYTQRMYSGSTRAIYIPCYKQNGTMDYLNPPVGESETQALLLSSSGYSIFSSQTLTGRVKIECSKSNTKALVSGFYVVVDYTEPTVTFSVTQQWLTNTGEYKISGDRSITYVGKQFVFTVNSSHNWNVVARTISGGNWLDMSPTSGTSTNQTFTLTLRSMPNGETYETYLDFYVLGRIRQTIHVTLTTTKEPLKIELSGEYMDSVGQLTLPKTIKPGQVVSFIVKSNFDWEIRRGTTTGTSDWWFAIVSAASGVNGTTEVELEIISVPEYGSTFSTALYFYEQGGTTVIKSMVVSLTIEGTEAPYIEVVGVGYSNGVLTIENSNYSSESGTASLFVDSNFTWTVSSNAAWLSASNLMDQYLIVRVNQEPVNETFTGQLTLSVNNRPIKTITVNYTKSVPIDITITGNDYDSALKLLNVPENTAVNGSCILTVRCSYDWTAQTDSDWFTVTKYGDYLYVIITKVPVNDIFQGKIEFLYGTKVIEEINVSFYSSGGIEGGHFPPIAEKQHRTTWVWGPVTEHTYNAKSSSVTYTMSGRALPKGAVVTRVMAYVKVRIYASAPANTTLSLSTMSVTNGPSLSSGSPAQKMPTSFVVVAVPETGCVYLAGNIEADNLWVDQTKMAAFFADTISVKATVAGGGSSTELWMHDIFIAVDYKLPSITWNTVYEPDHIDGQVVLKWQPVTVADGTGDVTYSIKDEYKKYPDDVINAGNMPDFMFGLLTPTEYDKELTYVITAYYSGVESEYEIRYKLNGKISPPINLVVKTTKDDKISLTWLGAQVEYGKGTVSKYNLKYSNDSGALIEREGIAIPSDDSSTIYTFTIEEKIAETEWTFEIIALYSENEEVTSTVSVQYVVSYGRPVKYFNGVDWVDCLVYVVVNNEWVECIPMYCDGKDWIEI